MNKYLLTFLVVLLLSHSSSAQKVNQFNWLIGTWKIKTGSNLIVENWKVINDSTLAGKSVFIKNGTDTIPQESIEILFRKGNWFYSPTVISQNNSQPVLFKIIFFKGTEFICENPSHDFPQRISYRRINNMLHASIEGKKKGIYGKQNFDFTNDLE